MKENICFSLCPHIFHIPHISIRFDTETHDKLFYIAEYETLVQTGLLDDGVLDLTTEAPAPEYPGHAYTDLAEADWLLVSDDVPLDTTNLTLSGIACPAGYTLWQNHAPTQVQF